MNKRKKQIVVLYLNYISVIYLPYYRIKFYRIKNREKNRENNFLGFLNHKTEELTHVCIVFIQKCDECM